MLVSKCKDNGGDKPKTCPYLSLQQALANDGVYQYADNESVKENMYLIVFTNATFGSPPVVLFYNSKSDRLEPPYTPHLYRFLKVEKEIIFDLV